MGYTIHDWFDEKFTSAAIIKESEKSTSTTDVKVLLGSLDMFHGDYSSDYNASALSCLIFNELLKGRCISGNPEAMKYLFNLVAPNFELRLLVYKDSCTSIHTVYAPKEKPFLKIILDFVKGCVARRKGLKVFNLQELIANLRAKENIDYSLDEGSYQSSLDIFLDYVKSLSNNDFLEEFALGLMDRRFDNDNVNDLPLKIERVFSTLNYHGPCYLTKIIYAFEGHATAAVYPDLNSEE